MLSRLITVILAIACACAPVAGAIAAEAHEAGDCCCGAKCPCPPLDRGAPTAARANLAPAVLEHRAESRQRAARVARAPFAAFIFSSDNSLAPTVRLATANCALTAARVALFQAHCSLLL